VSPLTIGDADQLHARAMDLLRQHAPAQGRGFLLFVAHETQGEPGSVETERVGCLPPDSDHLSLAILNEVAAAGMLGAFENLEEEEDDG
jgi:hypothetical protein